jgi:hypothetical protein
LHHDPALAAASQAAGTELIWLLGQPQLSDYLDFVRHKVIGGSRLDPRQLVDEWRAANDHYYALEQREAGIADAIAAEPIEPELHELRRDIEANSWFRSSFDNLPFTILKVELDKLVVSQIHVERGVTFALAEKLGPKPSAADLFRLCLPLERALPPVRVERLGGGRYVFSSPSTDFRAHEPQILSPDQAGDIACPGPMFAMLGLPIGFGSNFLSGIRSGSRILLQNGYHRAFALRSIGITHAYCVVEDVTRKDELRLTATADVMHDPEFYFAAKRPPLLKDFFDPRIAKPLRVMAIENRIEVEVTVRSSSATPVAGI